MTKSSDRPENTVRCWCNRCRQDTLHSVEAERAIKVPGLMIHGQETTRSEHYMVVKCQGCEELHFLKVRIGSEDVVWMLEFEHPFDCPLLQTNYPAPNVGRDSPEWIEHLEPGLRDLLAQTYMALHIGADRLVVMGARAALELAIIGKCEDQGSFKNNVSKFIQDGYLAERNREAVMDALDVGSAAIHRAYKPDLEAIVDVLEILESVIHAAYIVPESGARRNEQTPRRNA